MFLTVLALGAAAMGVATPAAAGDPLRILVIGAHPDDCEYRVGAVATKWAALGHRVKFVSVTNGDIGHYQIAGGPLAQRRADEMRRADAILGVEFQVLDHHDGELMPSLDVRKELIRIIREWKADVVITHRPNDYHPDHRYTSMLVQDSAVMVTIPFMCPETPFIKENPVYLYMYDAFKKPYPFQPDVVVAVDDTIDKKLAALAEITSQFLEFGPWFSNELEDVPKDPEEAKKWIVDGFRIMYRDESELLKSALVPWYGQETANKVEQVEAFEICEYGKQPSPDDIRRLFPFFPPAKP